MHNQGMDLTVINDYTRNGMLKGCDDVFDIINKMFGTQEVVKTENTRKTASDLLNELGASRIQEGANRTNSSELFGQPLEHSDLEM